MSSLGVNSILIKKPDPLFLVLNWPLKFIHSLRLQASFETAITQLSSLSSLVERQDGRGYWKKSENKNSRSWTGTG